MTLLEESITTFEKKSHYELTKDSNPNWILKFSQLAEWLKDYKRLLDTIEDIKAEIDVLHGINSAYYLAIEDVKEVIDKHIGGEDGDETR